jgi:uroporphyrinogen III methyltransferase/synthase
MPETVVVTASAGAFPGLNAALQEIPVNIEERPLMNFVAPSSWTALHAALDRLAEYGTLVFTSPRAAEPFAAQLKERLPDWSAQGIAPAVWASGLQTAAALQGALGQVRLPLSQYRNLGAAKALARAMLEEGIAGPVLFPSGEEHREELPAELREHGIIVDEVVCYRSILAEEAEARVAASRGSVLIVASPRVAGLLARACPRGARPELLAVGPTTAESARMAGWSPAAMASEPTARALASAVRSLLANR